nr:MAG TPA: hypothetical protein [Caudoviricetes sp.]
MAHKFLTNTYDNIYKHDKYIYYVVIKCECVYNRILLNFKKKEEI